jgi:hypothetical protein
MAFSSHERKRLLSAYLVGPKLVGYLEAIGIDTLERLAQMERVMVCRMIAGYNGLDGWETHGMAIQAVENAIAAAREAVA